MSVDYNTTQQVIGHTIVTHVHTHRESFLEIPLGSGPLSDSITSGSK